MTEEGIYAGEFLLSEAPGYRSRETVTIDKDKTILAGTPLGQITLGKQTVTADAVVGTGDGALGTVTGDALAMAGDYQIRIAQAVKDGGLFEVVKPDGTLDGTGKVGTAYDGSLNFTLKDGAADFVAGDRFPVNVKYAAGSGLYVAADKTATDGSATIAAVAYEGGVTGTGETMNIVAIVRDAEVKTALIDLETGDLDEDDTVTALTALGIIARS